MSIGKHKCFGCGKEWMDTHVLCDGKLHTFCSDECMVKFSTWEPLLPSSLIGDVGLATSRFDDEHRCTKKLNEVRCVAELNHDGLHTAGGVEWGITKGVFEEAKHRLCGFAAKYDLIAMLGTRDTETKTLYVATLVTKGVIVQDMHGDAEVAVVRCMSKAVKHLDNMCHEDLAKVDVAHPAAMSYNEMKAKDKSGWNLPGNYAYHYKTSDYEQTVTFQTVEELNQYLTNLGQYNCLPRSSS